MTKNAYPYEYMCVFSCQIFDEIVCHNVHMNMVEYPNESIDELIMLMNVWNICRMFYIENIVLECVLFDVEKGIMNDRTFSDRDHMNKVLNPMNVYVVHGLRGHERWRNISHNRYIYRTNHFLRHRHPLFLHLLLRRFSRIVHSYPKKINSVHWEKINSNSIEHRRDISNVRLEERERETRSMVDRRDKKVPLLVISPPLICSFRWSNITSVSQFGKIDDMMEIDLASRLSWNRVFHLYFNR